MTDLTYTMYFTAKDGSEASITGDTRALEAIERAFERAGIKWNDSVSTWDEGFYTPIRRDAAIRKAEGR